MNGLRTGDADLDLDGSISVDELYEYVYREVRTRLPNQTPTRSVSSAEGTLVLARNVRKVMGSTWGLGETGATGPTGNRYGDAPGHACIGVVGPPGSRREERADTIETGVADRPMNMETFAWAALSLLNDMLGPE